jgi:hypothetical protein
MAACPIGDAPLSFSDKETCTSPRYFQELPRKLEILARKRLRNCKFEKK